LSQPLTLWRADPIFFLHHAQVDRLWWLWQKQAPNTRTLAYDGVDQNGRTVTLNDILPMNGLAADGIVRNFMDAKSADLCYTY
jgi:tyrosinase